MIKGQKDLFLLKVPFKLYCHSDNTNPQWGGIYKDLQGLALPTSPASPHSIVPNLNMNSSFLPLELQTST